MRHAGSHQNKLARQVASNPLYKMQCKIYITPCSAQKACCALAGGGPPLLDVGLLLHGGNPLLRMLI